MKRLTLLISLLAVLLASCGTDAPPAPTIDANAAMTQAFATVNAAMTATAQSSAPTETPVPTATPTRSGPPPELPPVYQSSVLNPLDTPHTYINEPCQYLRAKWDPNNAVPGTIVIVVMIHGIEKGIQTASKVDNIGSGDFKKMMNTLHEMGFTAINTQQLENFLYTNAKIPRRSVLLIQDDRKTGENFNDWFRPYWKEWGWPVVNAWINQDSYLDPNWTDNIALEKEGLVDHQAHGVMHMPSMNDGSSDEYIRSELQGSIDGIQKYYGKMPIAIIWPGGGFGIRPVQMARQLGFKLGFTTQPRGPIMFNWIPLADANDAGRPAYYAEGYVNDPLMVLPRYWDTDILYKLDEIRIMGNEAAAYAEQVKPVELEYYDIVCAPTLGPIPAAIP